MGTDADADLSLLDRQAAAVRERAGRWPVAVGVAVPATLDAGGRVVAWPTRPAWVGVDLAARLRAAFPGAALTWADDGDLAALAEAAAFGTGDIVYLGIGTGIGGGIVAGGRPVPPRGSCELGHLVIEAGGDRCDCGRAGCLQAIASGPATLRRATAGRGAPVDFGQLRDAYAAGTPWAVTAVGRTCTTVAAALAGVGELVLPALHVIGGGFAAGMPGFVDEVARQARRWDRPGHPVAPIRPARLGGRSSLEGALLAAGTASR